ncbi:MAG TPA: hypothetical protein VNA13_02825 [Xanthomonadales bacterium]|nr:hypothetical protein [Xanthomonadales bacterium]
MNSSVITQFLQENGFKQAVIILYLTLAIAIACYNWLYLYHSLHVTTKHMGLNAPLYIRGIIKTSIFLAVFTVGISIFLLLSGMY